MPSRAQVPPGRCTQVMLYNPATCSFARPEELRAVGGDCATNGTDVAKRQKSTHVFEATYNEGSYISKETHYWSSSDDPPKVSFSQEEDAQRIIDFWGNVVDDGEDQEAAEFLKRGGYPVLIHPIPPKLIEVSFLNNIPINAAFYCVVATCLQMLDTFFENLEEVFKYATKNSSESKEHVGTLVKMFIECIEDTDIEAEQVQFLVEMCDGYDKARLAHSFPTPPPESP